MIIYVGQEEKELIELRKIFKPFCIMDSNIILLGEDGCKYKYLFTPGEQKCHLCSKPNSCISYKTIFVPWCYQFQMHLSGYFIKTY